MNDDVKAARQVLERTIYDLANTVRPDREQLDAAIKRVDELIAAVERAMEHRSMQRDTVAGWMTAHAYAFENAVDVFKAVHAMPCGYQEDGAPACSLPARCGVRNATGVTKYFCARHGGL